MRRIRTLKQLINFFSSQSLDGYFKRTRKVGIPACSRQASAAKRRGLRMTSRAGVRESQGWRLGDRFRTVIRNRDRELRFQTSVNNGEFREIGTRFVGDAQDNESPVVVRSRSRAAVVIGFCEDAFRNGAGRILRRNGAQDLRQSL